MGYDHIWVYDHVETVPRREPTHCFEPYTMLSAISQHTNTVKLGQLVTCAAYRNAGHLAKQAACLDVMSGGRLILGLGAGWYEQEYEAYGYRYPAASERLAMLDETLQAVRLLWTEETTTFKGDHVHLDGAYCDPKPLQQLPAVWVGGGGEKKTLRIAARHADATNWQVGLESFVRKSELLERYCEEAGRPFNAITRTHGPDCRIFDSDKETRAWCEEPDGGNLWGRDTGRRVLERQPRGYCRTGGRKDAGLRRRRLPGVRPVAEGLPVGRDLATVRRRGRTPTRGPELMTKYDAILAETVRIAGHEGTEIAAYLARPLSPGPLPGVLVIHHMPGWDESTKEITRTFAVHGYSAICPHLHYREGPDASPDDAAAAARASGGVPDERFLGDADGSIRALRCTLQRERQGGCDRLLLGGPSVLPRRVQPSARRRRRLLRGVRRLEPARRVPAQAERR